MEKEILSAIEQIRNSKKRPHTENIYKCIQKRKGSLDIARFKNVLETLEDKKIIEMRGEGESESFFISETLVENQNQSVNSDQTEEKEETMEDNDGSCTNTPIITFTIDTPGKNFSKDSESVERRDLFVNSAESLKSAGNIGMSGSLVSVSEWDRILAGYERLIDQLKGEILFLKEENGIKNGIIQSLISTVKPVKHDGIKVYNSENTNLQELTDNEDFINPKRSRTLKLTKVQESDIIQRPMRPITIENRFRNLAFPNNEPSSTNFDDDDLTPSSNVDSTQSRKVKNNVKTLYNDNQSASFIPVKPGKETFSSTVINGRKISIFSDSILKGIRAQEFNDNIESGKASFKRFSGATSKQLNHYTLPTLIEESPNTVVIHVGTNDLKQKDKTKENIAKEIMNIGITSRKHGAKNIVISSIVTRRGVNLDRKRKEVNMLLKDMCVKEGFYYLDNDNVTFDKLYKDGVHLVENGSIVLANNILNFLNSLY